MQIISMVMRQKYQEILYGYLLLMFIGVLLVVLHVSANDKLTGVPEYVILGPGPVILVSPSKNQEKDCGRVSVPDCLKKLQTFLRLTSLPFTSDKAELDKLCSNAQGGYNCSSKLMPTPSCLDAKDRDLFPVFINMAQYTFFMFCVTGVDSQGYLRDALLENSECIMKQKEALDCCAEQTKVPELPIMQILDQSSKSLTEREISACCPVANYIRCVRSVLLSNCGDVAGNLTVEYIRRASGEQMEAVCQKMPGYPEPDPEVCTAPAAVCAGSRIENFIEFTVLMSLLFIMWIRYL